MSRKKKLTESEKEQFARQQMERAAWERDNPGQTRTPRNAHRTQSTTSPKVWEERRARAERSWAAKAGPVTVRKAEEK